MPILSQPVLIHGRWGGEESFPPFYFRAYVRYDKVWKKDMAIKACVFEDKQSFSSFKDGKEGKPLHIVRLEKHQMDKTWTFVNADCPDPDSRSDSLQSTGVLWRNDSGHRNNLYDLKMQNIFTKHFSRDGATWMGKWFHEDSRSASRQEGSVSIDQSSVGHKDKSPRRLLSDAIRTIKVLPTLNVPSSEKADGTYHPTDIAMMQVFVGHGCGSELLGQYQEYWKGSFGADRSISYLERLMAHVEVQPDPRHSSPAPHRSVPDSHPQSPPRPLPTHPPPPHDLEQVLEDLSPESSNQEGS